MTREQRNTIKEWFNTYVNGFESKDREIQQNFDIKREHSQRVVENMQYLAEYELDTENDRNIAETIAIIHDVGRFEQFQKYKTFLDAKSANHAELGLEIIEHYNILQSLQSDEKQWIIKSIRYHNRAEIPAEESGKTLQFSKLIRDADKLDIWKVVTDYFTDPHAEKNNAIEFDLPDTKGVTETVYNLIMERKTVNFKHLNNLNDLKLTLASWVFDLNFDSSVRLLYERGYLTLLKSLLPDITAVNEIYQNIESYIAEKTSIVPAF